MAKRKLTIAEKIAKAKKYPVELAYDIMYIPAKSTKELSARGYDPKKFKKIEVGGKVFYFTVVGELAKRIVIKKAKVVSRKEKAKEDAKSNKK